VTPKPPVIHSPGDHFELARQIHMLDALLDALVECKIIVTDSSKQIVEIRDTFAIDRPEHAGAYVTLSEVVWGIR